MVAVLQVGLEGVPLSSCSAAGMWRVRDLAGLGRDDLFSGLRYVRSCIGTTNTNASTHQARWDAAAMFQAELSIPALPSLPICLTEGGGGNMQKRGGPH